MAEKKKRPVDPAGAEWQEQAGAAWAEAELRATAAGEDSPLRRFKEPVVEGRERKPWQEPPLPNFNADKIVHVTRELYGRYIEDRATGMVHDCYMAHPGCKVDGIKNGTFYHFGHEVPEDLELHDCVEAI
jgi:hypothetical protein